MVIATSASKGSVSLDGKEKSKEYCQRLASQLDSLEELPVSCRNYGDIVKMLKSKTQRRGTSNPFEGMQAGEGAKAKLSRSKGTESHAQIQRRLTTSGRRFSKLEK